MSVTPEQPDEAAIAARVAEEIRQELVKDYTEGSELVDPEDLSAYDQGLADAENTIARVRDKYHGMTLCAECRDFYSGKQTSKHDLELGCAPDCPCKHWHSAYVDPVRRALDAVRAELAGSAPGYVKLFNIRAALDAVGNPAPAKPQSLMDVLDVPVEDRERIEAKLAADMTAIRESERRAAMQPNYLIGGAGSPAPTEPGH